MKLSTLLTNISLAWAVVQRCAQASSIRRAEQSNHASFHANTGAIVQNNYELPSNLERKLVQGGDLVPLSCNGALAAAICQPWTSRFGATSVHSNLVVVPCGECIMMDYKGPTLTLNSGIDIIGKLVFPENYVITLLTPFVIVQGELQMTSTKAVDGIPLIKLVMTGESNNTFYPQNENSDACGAGSPCLAGKKAIIVAGGKLNSKFRLHLGVATYFALHT